MMMILSAELPLKKKGVKRTIRIESEKKNRKKNTLPPIFLGLHPGIQAFLFGYREIPYAKGTLNKFFNHIPIPHQINIIPIL